jgi:hypothetical protein
MFAYLKDEVVRGHDRIKHFSLLATPLVACCMLFPGPAFANTQAASDAAQALTQIRSANLRDRVYAANNWMGLVARHQKALLKNSAVYNAVTDQLAQENDPWTRTQLINLAASLRVQQAYPMLLRIASQDKEIGIRRRALWAIAAINGASAIPDLKMAFTQDQSAGVRFEAAKQLGELGDDSGFDWALQNLKNDNSKRGFSRVLAAEALGAIGKEEAIPALKVLANSHAYGAGTAKQALLDIQSKHLISEQEKLDFLMKAMNDGNPGACWAVGKIAAMRTTSSSQILLNTARETIAVGAPGYSGHECARKAFENMYWDGTQETAQKIHEMEKTGSLQPLPEAD